MSMTTTQTTTTEMSTPALALAYFRGYQDGEGRAAVTEGRAELREVVEGFSAAVAARKVAREAAKAYIAGWRVAESMA